MTMRQTAAIRMSVIAAIVVGAVTAVAWHLYPPDHDRKEEDSRIHTAAAGVPMAASTVTTDPRAPTAVSAGTDQFPSAADTIDPFALAQQAWDKSRGIPNDDEWQDLLGMPRPELEVLARRGSVPAMTALGHQIVLESAPGSEGVAAGFSWLQEATLHGSTFAAQQLGELSLTHMAPGADEENFRAQIAASYYALSYAMGDPRGVDGFRVAGGSNPSNVAVGLYLNLGMNRLRTLQASRAARGMAPLPIEPRPGTVSFPLISPPEG